jgi:hypothetical protein
MKSLDGVPDSEIDEMTHLNAMRHYRFDPFSQRPKEMCTVGALRALATDVDVTAHPARGSVGESPGRVKGASRLTRASDLTRHPGTNR